MTTPQQTQAPAQPNANVTSANWSGHGVPQANDNWCFAAAEHMVHQAFGRNVSQAEIAHNCMRDRGRAEDPTGNAIAYYAGLRRIYNAQNLTNMNWTTMERFVRADGALFNLMRESWGNPQLTGRVFTRGNKPEAARIVQTIDAGGLVIIGSTYHWKVVYGYKSDSKGEITGYKVYNPWKSGTDDPDMKPGTMSNGIEETYYVTG